MIKLNYTLSQIAVHQLQQQPTYITLQSKVGGGNRKLSITLSSHLPGRSKIDPNLVQDFPSRNNHTRDLLCSKMPQLPQPATGASIIRRNVASAAMPLTLTPLSLHSFVAAVLSRINCYCLRHTKLIHRAKLSNNSSLADKTVEFIHRISKTPLLASSCRFSVVIIVQRVVHKKWQCDLPLQNFCTEIH